MSWIIFIDFFSIGKEVLLWLIKFVTWMFGMVNANFLTVWQHVLLWQFQMMERMSRIILVYS